MTDKSPGEEAASSTIVTNQLRDYIASKERRRRDIPRAIGVGCLAGAAAVAFRRSLGLADQVRDSLIALAHRLPAGFLVLMAVFTLGSVVCIWLVQRFAPETAGSGIPHVSAVLQRLHEMKWRRVLPVKFVGGVLGIGSGMALGREGPTIHMGAAVGKLVSDFLHIRPGERRTLIAAGAGAGLAAAFNAPLAGLMFVLEELQRDFATHVFTATFVAAVASDIVTRMLTGQAAVYGVPNSQVPSLESLPAFLVIGVVCGMLGVAYNKGLLTSLRLFARLDPARRDGDGDDARPAWRRHAAGIVVGVVLGVVGWFWPAALGDGHRIVVSTLTNASWTLWTLAGMFFLRFFLTMLCYGSGAPGGIFAPLLVLGSEIGRIVGILANHFVPSVGASPQTFAVVAMGAYFAAIVRSPLTGIVLIVEMTTNFSLLLALLIASLTAYAVANMFGDKPIYEALMEEQLHSSTEASRMVDTLLVELPLAAGAPFDGKPLKDLKLPTGCLLVAIRRGTEEIVPSGNSALQAGDWVVSVVSPQATDSLAQLRHGLGAPAEPGQTTHLPPSP